MDWEPWLHFAHVIGALVWVGGGVMLSLIGLRARRSQEPAVLRDFAELLSYVGLRVLMPTVVVVLLSGLWLVFTSSEWNFGQLWVLLGLAGFAAAFLIGAVYLSRAAIDLQRVATAAGDRTALDAAIGRWLTGYGLVLVILVLVVWDMVVKPGLVD